LRKLSGRADLQLPMLTVSGIGGAAPDVPMSTHDERVLDDWIALFLANPSPEEGLEVRAAKTDIASICASLAWHQITPLRLHDGTASGCSRLIV
jgi:hypothetical protein